MNLIIKSFPLHHKNELSTYNIYYQDSVKGLVESIVLKYPCIRQGCMTNCYFQAKTINQNIFKSQVCPNCNNKNTSKVYLDVGFKAFLQRHYKYIKVNNPLQVELNPIKKQFYFGSKQMKNSLICKLSDYIAQKLFEDLSLNDTPAIRNQILNFSLIHKDLVKDMVLDNRTKQYYCYSFCKYAYQPQERKREKEEHIYIILFIYGEKQPLKVKLVNQKKLKFCKYKDYITYGMVGLIGKINTLVIAIPTKEHGTLYFVANIHDLNREQKTLTLKQMKDWKDSLGRFNGSLIIDQNYCFVFVIGGFDFYKQDSLSYISCFLNCRWQGAQFRFEIEKSHHLFQSRLNTYNAGSFSTVYRNTFNENKITLKNSSFMIYSFNRQEGNALAQAFLQKREKLQKNFYNIGGGLKDSSIFASGRFSTQKPGIRYISYDQKSFQNPIISDQCSSTKIQLNFTGVNYNLVELPYHLKGKKKYKHHALAFGGQKDQQQFEKFSNHNFSQIFILDTNNIERAIRLEEKFHLSGYLNQNLDNLTTLMHNGQQPGTFYIRCTYPLHEPIYVKGQQTDPQNPDNTKKGGYIHYIAFQFALTTSLVSFIPGYLPEAEDQTEIKQQVK